MANINQYIRHYRFEDQVLLYNTINGEILIMPHNGIADVSILDTIDSSLNKYLYTHYFLDRPLPWDKFEKRYESNNCLLISLETSLACNLSCPYCYQLNNNHLKDEISKDNLNILFNYISEVHKKVKFDVLSLKILGGEPSLNWTQADYLLKKIIPFCKNNNVKLDLRIDTNCTNISKFLEIKDYDSILFTIPLCNKKIHDKYRHYRNGCGTYEDIINNAAILGSMPNCSIVLRHNTDGYNYSCFNEYLSDISSRNLKHFTIVPQFTTNPNYGDYENQLTYQQYVDWISSDCINYLVKYDFNVPIYPRLMLNGKCQHQSTYSLKLFSDGKVGACAAHFYDSENPYLSEIMSSGIDSIQKYWNGTKSTRLFNDINCQNCRSFFGCSGHYKLPCIQALGIEPCKPEEGLYLNWPLYFQTIYNHIISGKASLFPGIKITIF